MAFCKFYSKKTQDKLVLDTKFFSDFMPDASGDAVKVYLYGLYACQNLKDNTIEDLSNALGMTKEDIIEYMWYWHEQGIVNVIENEPMTVSFLPVDKCYKVKKYNENKYEQFNLIVQDIFESSRMITPTEYQAYYEVIEVKKIEIPALIMIIKFCVDFKGKNVNYPYILTICNDWANRGITTSELVEQQIETLNTTDGELKDVLTRLGIKRKAYVEEKQMYVKWIKDYRFKYLTVCAVAKSLKKLGGMKELDKVLTKYFELQLFSEKEIESYEESKNKSFELARNITRNLGLHYNDLNAVIEQYIIDWKNMGFDDEILLNISTYCFKNNYRSLNSMHMYLKKLYKLGVNDSQKFAEYMSQLLSNDEKIGKILEKLGLVREVNTFDRRMYKNWTESWQMPDALIECAIEKCYTDINPMNAMNRTLAYYHTQNITTVETAKSITNYYKPVDKKTFKSVSYTGDLNALFDNLDEIDL